MKPLTIRASLTAWFIGLAMVLVAGFSITMYTTLVRALRDSVDAGLQARALAMLSVCEWDEEIDDVEFKISSELSDELAQDDAHRGDGVEVWTWPAKRLLHRSGAPIPGELPATLPEPVPEPVATFTDLSGEDVRRLCVWIGRVPATAADADDPERPAFDILVRAAHSLAPVEAQIRAVAWKTLALVGVSCVVVLAFGAFLSRRVVRPLRDLERAAAAVRPGEVARLPVRGSGDEVDQLAGVLDRAFASLKDASDRQARFTANAAHELRNPISIIHNAADVALRRPRTADEYQTFLADVLATSKQMGGVVETLLLLARLDAGAARVDFHDVDLSKVARLAVAALAADPRRIRVLNGSAAVVRGEEGLLRILVENLLANALHYSNGQPIELTVHASERGGVALDVRDFGPGVPDHQKPQIFERFFRGDGAPRHKNGAGLGLSIVADVARLHSAQYTLEDAGPGTRVRVWFPANPG